MRKRNDLSGLLRANVCVALSGPAALGGDDGVSAAAEMAIYIVLRIGRGSVVRSRFHLAFRCAGATSPAWFGSVTRQAATRYLGRADQYQYDLDRIRQYQRCVADDRL